MEGNLAKIEVSWFYLLLILLGNITFLEKDSIIFVVGKLELCWCCSGRKEDALFEEPA